MSNGPGPAKNFSWYEVECPCCRRRELPDLVRRNATALAVHLQDLRNIYGPVIVTSWYRCAEHNRAVGGSSASYHLTGMAADIKCAGCPDLEVWANFMGGGVGTYERWPDMVHVDIRGRKARWRH